MYSLSCATSCMASCYYRCGEVLQKALPVSVGKNECMFVARGFVHILTHTLVFVPADIGSAQQNPYRLCKAFSV